MSYQAEELQHTLPILIEQRACLYLEQSKKSPCQISIDFSATVHCINIIQEWKVEESRSEAWRSGGSWEAKKGGNMIHHIEESRRKTDTVEIDEWMEDN